jgi:ribonuclease J
LTSFTFYGGVNEIGGNKILLEDKDTKVFLDFGKGFSRRAKFFEEYINPRVANGIEDFLTMGLLPDIKGLYRDDLMKMAEREILEPEVDAVLLTHAHSDHADYISFLHEKIPIYMGDTLAKKYLGVDKYPFPTPFEKRITLKIKPERVFHQQPFQ